MKRCGYRIIRPPNVKYPKIIRAQKRINDKPKNFEASNPFLKSRLNPNIPTSVEMTKLYKSSTMVSKIIPIISKYRMNFDENSCDFTNF